MQPLALIEGVRIILAMLIVGLIFLAVIGLGEWIHHRNEKRAERRRARQAY